MAAIGSNPQLSSNLPLFSDEFMKTFDHPSNGADAAGRLHSITQGSRSAVEYTFDFRTLAADGGWDGIALRSAYRRGLSEEIKDLLVLPRTRHPRPPYGRMTPGATPGTSPAPGEFGPDPQNSPSRARLCRPRIHPRAASPTVSRPSDSSTWGGRAHAAGPVAALPGNPQLCLCCGKAPNPGLSYMAKRFGSLGGGVLVSRTYTHSHSPDVNKLFPASLAWRLESLSVGALLDSGADECLIDVTLARRAGISLEFLDAALSTQALDGHSLGNITHRTVPLSLTLSGKPCRVHSVLCFAHPHCTTSFRPPLVRYARPPRFLVHWADSWLERGLSC